MQLISLLATVFVAVGVAEKEVTNPLSKVIDLLKDLSAKVTADGEAEAKAYKEYFEWCDDAAANTKYAIETATKKKAKLEAKIAQLGADIETGAAKIEDLAAAIATNEADLKAATAIRAKEAAAFGKAEAELMSTIDTLTRAIATLEREMAKKSSRICTDGYLQPQLDAFLPERCYRCSWILHCRQKPPHSIDPIAFIR